MNDLLTMNVLLENLQNPALYSHPVTQFEVIETHISWVLLTGNYAYKIKKPVNFGFLDFSTLGKRHYYCEEELRLNRRLASELYLEVVVITGDEEAPQINGNGQIFEYAVKMRQFPQSNVLNNLLKSGQLGAEDIDELAGVIANFHANIEIADDSMNFGMPEKIIKPVLENFLQIRQSLIHPLNEGLRLLEEWSRLEHQRLVSVFEYRKKYGFIRECHGDLHLANIVLFGNKIVPFDGIEFNNNLRWIDVMSEVAFLVMDLKAHQRQDFGFQVLNSYLEQTGDYLGLQVLRFYCAYRAMVRAKINILNCQQHKDEQSFSKAYQEYNHYLQLASEYTQMGSRKLVICHGLSGSGKTIVSQLLLQYLPAIRIRSDVERKRLFGMDPQARSHSSLKSGLYSPEVNEQTYLHLLELAKNIINSGFSVIVDATFLKHQQRRLFQNLALELNIPLTIVSCQAKDAVLRERVINREQTGNDASEAGVAVLELQKRETQPLLPEEKKVAVIVNSGKEIQIDKVIKKLK
jgi:aminoglycoside phosphotransferase family enzyme/adenylate kinase family enzyme